jgi:hypothetical protein
MVCVKGATVAESLDRDRLKYPMWRESLAAPFERVSWDVALDAIVERIQTVGETLGPDGLCVYGSGQFQTEDYYVAQKLVKGCLGTNNFDTNSRLCMSSAVSAYSLSFGADGPRTRHIVGSIANDVDPFRRKLLPMARVGPPLGMGSQLISHGRVIGKGTKFKKVIHPIAGKFQARSLFNVSRQEPLHQIGTPMRFFQNSENSGMKAALPLG